MKKFTALLLLCCMVVSCFSGCSSDNEDNYVPTGNAILMEGEEPEINLFEDEDLQQLTLAYAPERSMNPLIGYNITNRVLFSLIYQGLFAVDRKNNTTPILCSSYRVEADNRTYTFFVDPNARFSDGTRVTIDDVFATYTAARDSNYYKGRFTYIDRFELSEDGGITFYLTTPYQNLAILLDIPIVKAGEVADEHPLGTGPYTFDIDGNGIAKLHRVQEWWCKANLSTAAQTIDLMEGDSQAQIRDDFEFGELDLACANPLSDSFAEYRCDYELWECESGMFLYLGVNVLYSDYFKNTDVLRKALTYAIDREKINEDNYRGMAQVTTLPTSPGCPYYSPGLAEQFNYDPMRFVDAIAGFQIPKDENGAIKKLRLLVNQDDSARLRTARDIAAHLTELGIPCGTLEYGNSTRTTYEQVLRAGTFDLYLGQTRLPPTMDLSEFFRAYGNLGWGGIADGTLLNMCKEALANSGNFYNLNQMVAEDAKIIPVLFGNYTVYAERGQLLDLAPSRDNVFYYSIGKTMSGIRQSS